MISKIKRYFLILSTCISTLVVGQPLTDGMAIVTHWTGSGQWDSFSIFDTQNNAAAPLGLNWATTFHTPADPAIHAQWKGDNMGDVFGIAIDSEKNVFFSATKAISASGSTSTQIGPAGDGGVYKMDANDWSISSFITTGTGANQIPNVGVGLGNICYDRWNDQLFITNFEDGMIYRFDMDGNLLSTFDPFNADDGTAGFAGHQEALWGVCVHGSNENDLKVYFSQWTEDNSLSDPSNPNNAVWSIDLDATGDFSGTEVLCFNLPDYTGSFFSFEGQSYPISDIAMSSEGKMYVVEKTQGGWGSFNGFTDLFTPGAHSSRMFEYEFVGGSWQMSQQYGVGNYNTPASSDNTAGGVAISNRQTATGDIECEKLIWATGDALRFSGFNPADGGQTYVYGATSVPVEGNTLNVGAPDYVQNNSIYVDIDYTGTGSNGSQKSSYGDIEIYSDAVAEAFFNITPNTTICQGESIALSVTGGFNYQWTPNNTLDSPTSSTPTATPTSTTTYTVDGEGSCGGTAQASVTISIDDFSFSLGPDQTICQESTTSITLDAGSEANSYNWSTGENSQTISVSNPNNYSVLVTSPNNCPYSDDIVIGVADSPIVDFSVVDSSSCPPANFQLLNLSQAQSNDPIANYSWIIDGEEYNSFSPLASFDQAGLYSVSLRATSEQGCVGTKSVTDLLEVYPLPQPYFTISENLEDFCGTSYTIQNLSSNYTNVLWTIDTLNISMDTLSSFNFAQLGAHYIGLELQSADGCYNDFKQKIIVEKESPFYAPNAFTPNDDGENDVFFPNVMCATNFELWIMNRWGEEIFYTNDMSQGWDGKYKETLCPQGIYSWKVRYQGVKEKQVQLGHIHLMR